MAIVVVVAPRGAPASIRLREAPSPSLLGNTERRGGSPPGASAVVRSARRARGFGDGRLWYPVVMPNAVVPWLVLLVACGAAEPSTGEPVTPTEPVVDDDVVVVAEDHEDDDVLVVEEDGDGEDVMRCRSDDDCVLGGPPRCCTSSGPDCVQAWSRVAWEAFRAECAVRECDRDVMLACPEREGPPPTAACVDARCVLR
jgi:hypothetical protein